MKQNPKKVILVCVAGGSAGGKTTVAQLVQKNLPKGLTSNLICLDSFYRNDLQKVKQNKLHTNINFDHPESFDWELINKTINNLLKRQSVKIPIYDYVKSERSNKVELIQAKDVIILEGIFALFNKSILEKANLKIFVETPDDERFIRRFLRDKNERGRVDENIIAQWRNVVRPMHVTFIQPQKVNADIIIPWHTTNEIAIRALKCTVQELVIKK